MRAWLFGFGFFFKLGFLQIELIEDIQDESVLMMINSRKTSAWI